MTNLQVKGDATLPARAESEEAQVVAFLGEHPDFFDRHASLLSSLRLPHHRGDATTVSLVERQIDVLRDRARDLEQRLRTLVENGHANDTLAEKIHRLAIAMIQSRGAAPVLEAIESSLRKDFGAREFVIVLRRPLAGLGQIETRCLRIAAAEDPDLKSFEALFASRKPRCGRVRDSQRDYLFPSADIAVGSVALVPLGDAGAIGLLAIASPDVDHFNPTMSTDFLARIGELIATALHAASGTTG